MTTYVMSHNLGIHFYLIIMLSSAMCNLDKVSRFTPTTQDEVKRLVLHSSSTTCENDPLPTCLVKQHINVMAPLITKSINKSLETGCVPDDLKHAKILPLINKEGSQWQSGNTLTSHRRPPT